MGQTFNFADDIFQKVYDGRTCQQNERNGSCKRSGKSRIYRRAFRIRIFILEHIFNVLLQLKVDGGGGCGLVCVLYHNGDNLLARPENAAQND